MTENEAIDELRMIKYTRVFIPSDEVWEMSIQALEEIQRYRAMEERLKKVYGECDGLLEVVVSGLERHENLELPSITVKSKLLIDEDVDNWDAYRAIGTIDEFKTLKEKSVAKKVFRPFGTHSYKCPSCWKFVAHEVDDNCDLEAEMAEWCKYCGQKLDWSK